MVIRSTTYTMILYCILNVICIIGFNCIFLNQNSISKYWMMMNHLFIFKEVLTAILYLILLQLNETVDEDCQPIRHSRIINLIILSY